MNKRIIALLLGTLPALVLAAPRQVHTTYDLYRNDLKIGTVTESYQQTGNHYRIESRTAPAGIAALVVHQTITATSSGRVNGHHLIPEHFEQRSSAGEDKTVAADFNWPQHTLTMRHDGKTDTAPLVAGTQDRLSLVYQLMLAPPSSPSVAVAMTTGKKLEKATFRDLGSQTVETPAGAIQARHLSRLHQPDTKGMDVWLAPDKAYLAVQIRMTDDSDGTRFEQRLSGARISQQ